MVATIVKIDLVGSKAVSAANQLRNPGIRKQLLDKLLEISRVHFPASDTRYPTGTYYKAEGDAVYYILSRPTTALRAAIEFMQSWFGVKPPDLDRCPDCRVMIDRGDVQTVDTPAGVDFVSAAFENIAVAEKGLQGGRIYGSQDVVDNCDRTLARFVCYGSVKPRANEQLMIYYVEFLDPRTTADSSLLHALFVAHPKSEEARDRVLELFILEFLLENGRLNDLTEFNDWARSKSYPTLLKAKLEELCGESSYVKAEVQDGKSTYLLRSEALDTLNKAREDFRTARQECIDTVQTIIVAKCGTPKATDQYDLPKIIEEYLCAIFADVRMMANYFRETSQLFNADANVLERFDYILKRHLPFSEGRYLNEWRTAFIEGLQAASAADNAYVAAVFHNVLATYYLNRSSKPSAYQLDKVAKRHLYIDTNVLYALLVPASSYHEAVRYFVERLKALETTIRIYPFTIDEYEKSLAAVEREVKKNEVSASILRWNPWLYQEFRLNKGRYLGQIEVCRQMYSVAKGKQISQDAYDAIDSELAKLNLQLDREFTMLSEQDSENLWAEMRGYMTQSAWSIDEYYDFIHESTKSPDKIAHDAGCIHNLIQKFATLGRDELGPKLMFITLDRQLARAQKKYGFIVSSEQFIEFMMPHLFLSDIPLKDAEKFPNQLLSAQLGTLLVRRKVEITDLVRGFLSDPKASKQYENGELGSVANDIATTLSSSRFQGIMEQARQLDTPNKQNIAEQIAAKFEETEMQKKTSYFEKQAALLAEFKKELESRDRQIEKLRRKVKYFKGQRR
jgi:hypothetical protein